MSKTCRYRQDLQVRRKERNCIQLSENTTKYFLQVTAEEEEILLKKERESVVHHSFIEDQGYGAICGS